MLTRMPAEIALEFSLPGSAQGQSSGSESGKPSRQSVSASAAPASASTTVWGGTLEDTSVVTLTQRRIDPVGHAFLVQRELRIETASVATRVDSVPSIGKMHSGQTVQRMHLAVSQALIAQASGDPLCAEDRYKEMRLGKAQSRPVVQNIGGADRDPSVLGINRVCNLVAYPFERRTGEVGVIAVLQSEFMS